MHKINYLHNSSEIQSLQLLRSKKFKKPIKEWIFSEPLQIFIVYLEDIHASDIVLLSKYFETVKSKK